MSQILRPVANESPQEWFVPSESTDPAWEQINDDVDSSDEFLSWISAGALDDGPARARFTLGAGSDPGTNVGVRVRARHWASRGGAIVYPVRLYEGATLRATTYLTLSTGGAFETVQGAFPENQIANITSFSALSVEVDTGDLALGGGQLLISSLQVELPDVTTDPDGRITRHALEVVAKTPTLGVRTTRHAVEVVGPVVRTLVTQLGVEVCGDEVSLANVRVTRHAAEVVAKNSSTVYMTQLGVEVLGDATQVRVTRNALEVVAVNPVLPQVRLTQLGVEVIGLNAVGGLVRVTREALEVVAKNVIEKVTPLPLGAVVPAFLRANWTLPITMDTSYQTTILQSPITGMEERLSLVKRPQRLIRALVTALSTKQSGEHVLSMLRRQNARAPVQLFQDVARILSNPTSTLLNVDARWRRFYPGARVVVYRVVGATVTDVAYRTLVSVSPSQLGLSEALPITYDAAGRVAPCIDAEIILQSDVARPVGFALDMRLAASEVIGMSTLPPAVEALPPSPSSYATIPVLDLMPDWATPVPATILRPGRPTQVGKSALVELTGERGVHVYTLELPFLSRERFWEILSWFDGARGRGRVFWQVGAGGHLDVTSIATTHVDVEPTVNLTDVVDFVRYVAVRTRDGSTHVRGVKSVTIVGDAYRLTFDLAIPSVDLGDVTKVAVTELARFYEDSMTEEWRTNEIGSVTLRTVGLLRDKPVVIEPVDELVYDYGAKYEPPVIDGERLVVQGLGHFNTQNDTYIATLGGEHHPGGICFNTNVGYNRPGQDPVAAVLVSKLHELDAKGGIPSLGISMQDFGIPTTTEEGLDDLIATTTLFDPLIQEVAQACVQYNKPLFVRIGWEANNEGENPHHLEYYALAYNKIANAIKAAGATKVAFEWGILPFDGWLDWYPGDENVDWCAVDIFSKATFMTPGQPAYETLLEFLAFADARGRPVSIPETGCVGPDVPTIPPNPTDASAIYAYWFQTFFDLLRANPVIKRYHYVTFDFTGTVWDTTLGWKESRLDVNETIRVPYVNEISGSRYVGRDDLHLLKGYTEAL